MIGKVDPKAMRLVRESVTAVDGRQPCEDASLQLSNFHAHEDRETGEIVLHLSRFLAKPQWHGDAFVYRIRV